MAIEISRFIPPVGYGAQRWPEILSVCLLIIGLILSFMAGSLIMYLIVAFLTGAFFGHLWYKTRKSLQFTYFMMITCFMIGFVIGSFFTRYGNPKTTPILTILVYLVGIILSYMLHKKRVMDGIDF